MKTQAMFHQRLRHQFLLLLTSSIFVCSISLKGAAADEIHFICYDSPPGNDVYSVNRLKVTNIDKIADGVRTCSFEVSREWMRAVRLLVQIPPEKSPDCDADELLYVGEDESSLEKVCGDQSYSKRYHKSFLIRYSQRSVKPLTDGPRVNVTQIVLEELLRCNKTFDSVLETKAVTISETFEPGKLELPYHCWWRFTYTNSRLVVNINSVELAPSMAVPSSNCGNNSLVVRDGWEADHKLMFETCQNNSLEYLTTGYSAWVGVDILQPSDVPFLFNFSVIDFKLTQCDGQVITLKASSEMKFLESPGYPDQVLENLQCRWMIESDDVNEVEIEFTDMNIDDHCDANDMIEVYDGPKSTSQKLVSMCYPPIRTLMKYRSSSKVLYLYWRTDGTNYGRGFRMKYSTQKFPSDDLPKENECRTGTVNLKADTTERYIETPGYPGSYPNDQKCTWMIESDDGDEVEVEMEDMQITGGIDCFWDSLSIYDGKDTNKSPLVKLCGQFDSLKGKKFRSSGNGLMLRFKSTDPGGRKGFKLKYYTRKSPSPDLADVTSCRGKLTRLTANETIQYIETEDYPNSTLVRNEDCRWLIHAPGHRVEVNILGFELGPNNIINRISVMSGQNYNEDSNDPDRIVNGVGNQYQSEGEYLMIRYNTDRENNKVLPNQGGFRLSYSIMQVDITTTVSGTKKPPGPVGRGTSLVFSKGSLITTFFTTVVLMQLFLKF